MNTFIGYTRVSTDKQAASGLGLAGQVTAIEGYAQSAGGRLLASYQETESGRNNDRPQLAKAMAHAKRIGATLIIAKLDRLARNVHFISGLMESGVQFVAVDNPVATPLTLHILAAVAEAEAAAISSRTKAALAAAKARGQKLGSARPGHWKGRENARRAGGRIGAAQSAAVRRASAVERVRGVIESIRDGVAGGKSLRTMADDLNAAGERTARGGLWGAMAVVRAIRLAESEAITA